MILEPKVFKRSLVSDDISLDDLAHLERLESAVNASVEARGLLYGPNIKYEEPNVMEIEGLPWKGKADVVNDDIGYLVDLKTTGYMPRFKQAAEKYGYTSQAWIYYKLFGLPTKYVIVDKTTCEVDVWSPPRSFYVKGKARALEACEKYQEYVEKNNKS